ncbi:hypothetical protein Emed_005452 [Eimeria media]
MEEIRAWFRKPLADRRQYRYVELQNRMRVLLVHDPEGDEAAASLRVGVGAAGDPQSLQGLAHFTEHMLFQGSRHFPGGHSFLDFVHVKGGKANAFTSKFGTTFAFSLAPRFLREALVRLTDIFSNPEFKEEHILKEIHAVHSEYTLRATDDVVRFAHFVRQSKLQTPFSNFSVGSIDTLLNEPKALGLDVALEMRRFHQRWYSSNLMTLAVVGRESLDELETQVASLLGQIENRHAEKPKFTECSLDYQPFAADELRTITVAAPQSDLRQLRFLFALPPQEYAWDIKPISFLMHFVELQGPESLSSKLKKLGLVTAVSSAETGPEYCTLLEVRFTLTEEGLKEESIATIGDLFFSYLSTIRSTGLEAWRYEELAEVRRQMFEFEDMESAYALTQRAAEGLRYFPPREVLAGDKLMYQFEKNLLLSVIDSYLNPNNMRVLILDKALGEKGDRVEPKYNVRHSTKPIDEALLNRWKASFWQAADSLTLQQQQQQQQQQGMSLPGPNPFIARSLRLEETRLLQLPVHPRRLVYGPGHPCHAEEETAARFSGVSAAAVTCNVFHKKDDTFGVPKTAVSLDFYFKPKGGDTLREHLMTALYVRLASFSIIEAFNSAAVAGVSALLAHGVHSSSALRPNALALHAVGFTPHLPALLRAVAACLGGEAAAAAFPSGGGPSPPCPTPRPFLMREFVSASWEGIEVAAKLAATSRSPAHQAADAFGSLVVSPFIDPKEMLSEVQSLKAAYKEETADSGDSQQWLQRLYEDIVSWGSTLWTDVYVEGLIHGSLPEPEAAELLTSVLSALPVRRLVSAEEAEAQVAVSPLETLSSKDLPHERPTRIFVQSRSAPLRRLRLGQALQETADEGEETEEETKADPDSNPPSCLRVSTLNSNPFDAKNHTLMVVQAGDALTVKEKASAYLVHQQMSQLFFNVLRTDEQLGYLTSMTTMRVEAFLYFAFSITSLYDPAFVSSRIQHFLNTQRRQRLSSELLHELKEGAVAFWRQKPKCLLEEFQRHFHQIKRREYIFDFHEQMVERIQEVDEEALNAYREEKLFSSPSVVIQLPAPTAFVVPSRQPAIATAAAALAAATATNTGSDSSSKVVCSSCLAAALPLECLRGLKGGPRGPFARRGPLRNEDSHKAAFFSLFLGSLLLHLLPIHKPSNRRDQGGPFQALVEAVGGPLLGASLNLGLFSSLSRNNNISSSKSSSSKSSSSKASSSNSKSSSEASSSSSKASSSSSSSKNSSSSSRPQTLTGAVLSAAESSKGLRARGVTRRLVTAASLLETQKAKDSVTLLRDTEALDSDVRPPNVHLLSGTTLSPLSPASIHEGFIISRARVLLYLPKAAAATATPTAAAAATADRLVDASIHLLTVVALCIFAFCAGLLVGAVVSRATLTPGMVFLNASRYGSSPFAELLLPDTPTGSKSFSPDTTAVFRAQFLVSLPVNNMGAFIESLSMYLELLYLPAGGLPDASQCFSPSDTFSSTVSFFPSEQYPSPAAAAALLSRARASYSTIKRQSVSSLLKGDNSPGANASLPLLHILLPRSDATMHELLSYTPADTAQSPAVGPTLLLANLVPFVPGISGLDAVSLYVGLNLPLEAEDSALLEALKKDCQDRKRVYLQLRTPAVSGTSMFFQQARHPFLFSAFPVPCSLLTLSPQQWPPETPPSFVAEVKTYDLEMAAVSKADGQQQA